MDELIARVEELDDKVLVIGNDVVWIKRIGFFIAVAILGQLVIKLFT